MFAFNQYLLMVNIIQTILKLYQPGSDREFVYLYFGLVILPKYPGIIFLPFCSMVIFFGIL